MIPLCGSDLRTSVERPEAPPRMSAPAVDFLQELAGEDDASEFDHAFDKEVVDGQ